MAKFDTIRQNLEGPLSTGLTVGGTAVTAYPENYQGSVTATEFVRMQILYGASSPQYAGGAGVSGQLVFSVFVPAGQGPIRANDICDQLDTLFQTKVLNDTQTFSSSLAFTGLDTENPNLYRVNYSVPFRHYS